METAIWALIESVCSLTPPSAAAAPRSLFKGIERRLPDDEEEWNSAENYQEPDFACPNVGSCSGLGEAKEPKPLSASSSSEVTSFDLALGRLNGG